LRDDRRATAHRVTHRPRLGVLVVPARHRAILPSTEGVHETRDDPDLAAKLFERAALTSPTKAARTILRGAEKNRARILVGPDGRAAAAVPRLLGARYAGLFARAARLTNFASAHASR